MSDNQSDKGEKQNSETEKKVMVEKEETHATKSDDSQTPTIEKDAATPILEQFLRDEIQNERDSLFWTRSLGGGLAVFVFFYLWTFVYEPFTSVVLNPENLGRTIVYKVDDQIPAAVEDLEANLSDKAPRLAEKSASDIRALVPLIGEYGVQHVDVLVEMLSQLDQVTVTLTDLYFEEHGDSIREYVENYGRAKFIEKFADDTVAGLLTEFEEALGLNDSRSSHTSVGLILEIANEVERLASKDSFNMTLSERLQRRLIVAWTHFLSDSIGSAFERDGFDLLQAAEGVGMARLDPARIVERLESKPDTLANYSGQETR